MKRLLFLIILGLFANKSVYPQEALPPLNRQIVKYVKSTIGYQIDRGECWDLAYQALKRVEADWDGEYVYGKKLDPKKDKILPGDIIQFENVVLKYYRGTKRFTERMEHHTAIVYKIKGKGVFEIAHQNTSFSGRTVGLSTLDLGTIVDGQIFIYRPVKQR